MKFIYKKQSFLLHNASNINQTAVGLFWLSNNNFTKLKFIEFFFFFYILIVCFIEKADNSTFHVLE